jgi:anti-sigma regulatory factor (Ser/Thr protein kinase)
LSESHWQEGRGGETAAVVALQRRFAPTTDAPGEARALLAAVGKLSDEMGERARLLVSELVTNALQYGADSPIEVKVALDGDALEVTVAESGRGFEAGARLGHPDVGGWGLRLVDTLAEAWSSGHGGESWVWFRLEPRS